MPPPELRDPSRVRLVPGQELSSDGALITASGWMHGSYCVVLRMSHGKSVGTYIVLLAAVLHFYSAPLQLPG